MGTYCEGHADALMAYPVILCTFTQICQHVVAQHITYYVLAYQLRIWTENMHLSKVL